jgi:Transposase DDE domain
MLKGMELCHRTLPSARQSSTLPDGEGLETGRPVSLVPRQPLTRQRTFGWFNNYRRLSKDYEYCTDNSETMLYIAMIHVMVRRLA